MDAETARRAAEQARGAIHAAEVLHARAPVIARACAKAVEGEVVVAVVEPEFGFGGAWTVPADQLHERDQRLAQSGWSLIFSPHTPVDEIEGRALTMARQAFRRWEGLCRWAGHHR